VQFEGEEGGLEGVFSGQVAAGEMFRGGEGFEVVVVEVGGDFLEELEGEGEEAVWLGWR
jgi:hypothetical protein